jgi:hypothetical protein
LWSGLLRLVVGDFAIWVTLMDSVVVLLISVLGLIDSALDVVLMKEMNISDHTQLRFKQHIRVRVRIGRSLRV